jgi:2-polyprenyl-6-methoxyphenol hydroxylase-like FAD-dependent oxidoreductase
VLVDQATRCAVVGGGPGGVMLAYLLARAGVPVTLLEARPDFDRRFRGDALALSVLELLDVLVWPIRCSPRSRMAQRTASIMRTALQN